MLHIVFIFPIFNSGFRIDIGLVADGNKLCESQIEVFQNVENATAQGTGLRHKTDTAALGQAFGKAAVHANIGVCIDNAKAIGTHAAHSISTNFFQERFFQFGPFFTGFFEACADHAQSADAFLMALINCGEDKFCINHNDSQINFTRHV